jgi:hypothetical protein
MRNLLNMGRFPVGGIFRAERNFSLSFLISSTKQRKILLRAENSAQWKTALRDCLSLKCSDTARWIYECWTVGLFHIMLTMDIFLQTVVPCTKKAGWHVITSTLLAVVSISGLRSEEKPLRANERSFEVATVQITELRTKHKCETGKTNLTSFCCRVHG